MISAACCHQLRKPASHRMQSICFVKVVFSAGISACMSSFQSAYQFKSCHRNRKSQAVRRHAPVVLLIMIRTLFPLSAAVNEQPQLSYEFAMDDDERFERDHRKRNHVSGPIHVGRCSDGKRVFCRLRGQWLHIAASDLQQHLSAWDVGCRAIAM